MNVDLSTQMLSDSTALRMLLHRHQGLLELLSVGADAAPVLDELRERLVAILRSAGLEDRIITDGLGGLVALTLGFIVGGRARHAGTPADVYDRLRALPTQNYPNLQSMAAQYADHWSDNAYTYGLEALLSSMQDSLPHVPES